jgi:hypothetical protein
MRRSRMTDQQGRWTEDDSGSGKSQALDALEHHDMKKERQAGEAQKEWVKLT